jgi:hypothetical protein
MVQPFLREVWVTGRAALFSFFLLGASAALAEPATATATDMLSRYRDLTGAVSRCRPGSGEEITVCGRSGDKYRLEGTGRSSTRSASPGAQRSAALADRAPRCTSNGAGQLGCNQGVSIFSVNGSSPSLFGIIADAVR